MANYESCFESTCIEVKNPDEFEKMLLNLGFTKESDGGYDGAWYEKDRDDDFTLYGYCGIPNVIYQCPFGSCPCEDDKTCGLLTSHDGEPFCPENEGWDYCLVDLIQPHIKEGTAVRITEIGNEKLRYLVAYSIVITPDDIFTDDVGIESGTKLTQTEAEERAMNE